MNHTITYNRSANTLLIPDDSVSVDEAVKNLCVATGNYHRALGQFTLGDGTIVILAGSGGRLADGALKRFLDDAARNLRTDIDVATFDGDSDDWTTVFAAITEIAVIATKW